MTVMSELSSLGTALEHFNTRGKSLSCRLVGNAKLNQERKQIMIE